MKRLSLIDEGVFSDILKRDNGKEVRKEDDINLLKCRDFYHYIFSKYRIRRELSMILPYVDDDMFSIPLFRLTGMGYRLTVKYDNGGDISAIVINAKKLPFFLDGDIRILNTKSGFGITDKEGNISNSLVLDIIDIFIKNRTYSQLEKIESVTEGVFSDILKRDNGEEVRREDDVILNIDDLECGLFLGGVYWASEQLAINGDYNVSIAEFERIPVKRLKGWRLPTRDEFKKMVDNGYRHSSSWYDTSIFDNPHRQGRHINLSIEELTVFQEEYGFNTIFVDEQGMCEIESVDKNDKVFDNKQLVTILLVRDNKI